MKDQYFGDLNDLAKYSLLRRIADEDLDIVVSWMLTPADARGDGRFIDYLDRPARYRPADPVLFDSLRNAVSNGKRTVRVVEEDGLIPGATFQYRVLSDARTTRCVFFDELGRLCNGKNVVFLDPDNGVEVPSVGKGRRNSSKYVYWDELKRVYSEGLSLVVYQHFPRVKRTSFLMDKLSSVGHQLAAPRFALYTSRVAFLVMAQDQHEDRLRHAAKAASEASDLRYWP